MADFEITAPDGRRFIVTAPEGASQADILRYAQQNMPAAEPVGAGGRIATGLGDPVQGGAQLLANSLPRGVVDTVNDATAWVNRQPVIGPVTRALGMTPATPEQINANVRGREAEYQASRRAAGAAPGETDWLRIGGQVIPGVAASLALRTPATLPGAVAQGAALGGAQGALEPVTTPGDFTEQKTGQVASGAAFGAAGGAVGNVVGRMLAPSANPQAALLRNEGVPLTPGQTMGGRLRGAEDRLTSAPIVGGAIREGQRNAVEGFNLAVGNRVLRPLGQSLPDGATPGREMVAEVGQRVSAAYDDVVGRMRPFRADRDFVTDLAAIDLPTDPTLRTAFTEFLNNRVIPRVTGQNGLDGATYNTLRSDIGRRAAEYARSLDPAQRELGDALFSLQGAFDDLAVRGNTGAVGRDLGNARNAYAQLIRLEAAAGATGATNGVFTPAQFSAAVRRTDGSLRHRAYARGDAMMQDLADAGRATLPSTVPDSGTGGRLATMAGLGTVAGIGATGVVPPAVAAALGLGAAGSLAYTRPGASVLNALALGQRPEAVRALAPIVQNATVPGFVAIPGSGMSAQPPRP